MTTKKKFLIVLGLFVFLIILSGFRAFGSGTPDEYISSVEELSGKKLGGMTGRMPDNSIEILFESILGQQLSGCSSYKTVDEALGALRSGDVTALWFCDVTANYLCEREDDLVLLETPDPALDRFEFGLAVKNDEQGQELCAGLNNAIAILKESGVMDELTAKYLSSPYLEDEEARKYQGDMLVNTADAYEDMDKLYIGISGTVLPIDEVDVHGRPYGFCVDFADELGQLLQRRIEFVVLDNETMFSALMSGRIDAVLAYGSGRNTVDTGKEYLVTDGYLAMKKYEIITVKEGEGE